MSDYLSNIKLLKIFIALFFLFSSCTKSPDEKLRSKLTDADKAEITFYGSRSNASGKKDINVTVLEKEKINRVIAYISEEPTPQFKCGYDGSIKFYKGSNVIQEMEFNLQPECMHIAFMLDSELYTRKITIQGIDYLTNIGTDMSFKFFIP